MASFSVTEDFSSDSNLDENELDHLVTAQVPQSTQNSTRWAIKAFEGNLFIYLFIYLFIFCNELLACLQVLE